jgi:DNA polymerase III epsilon subunit family exonuclease
MEFRSNFSNLLDLYDSIIVFDTETSGLDSKREEIIEISLIKLVKDECVHVSLELDRYIYLGRPLDPAVVELTGITDEKLNTDGLDRFEVAKEVAEAFRGHNLVVAHNANFDLHFLTQLFKKTSIDFDFSTLDFLDTLTIYKDRRQFPHKLCNAISAYSLEDKAVNSHTSIDDAYAALLVLDEMIVERDDIPLYINLLGYNPKYPPNPVSEIPKLNYCQQPFASLLPLYFDITNFEKNPNAR